MSGAVSAAFAQTAAVAKPGCFSSFSNWLDASAVDCPLSAYGLTFYGTVDVAGGYETHASPFNGDAKTAVGELIPKPTIMRPGKACRAASRSRISVLR